MFAFAFEQQIEFIQRVKSANYALNRVFYDDDFVIYRDLNIFSR